MSHQGGFEAFFDQDFLRLVLFLVKHGASRSEAEDAAQEAMVCAVVAWPRIERPRSWVRTTALRIWWKQTTRDAPFSEELTSPVVADPTVAEEEKWQVVALLRRLPSRQRAVAAWYYDGFDTKEIGQTLGMTEPTVRSHLRHARRRLREMVASESLEGSDGGVSGLGCEP